MVSRVALTPQGELTVLKLLAAGKDLEFVAAATTVQLGTVETLAKEHGWPDRDKLSFEAVQLQPKIDQAARNGLQRYTTSTPPRLHTAPPVPVQQASKLLAVASPTPAVAPQMRVEEFARVVELASKSHRAGTRNKAKKLQQLLVEVRELLKEESEHRIEEERKARLEAEVRREIAELEAQLAAAREKLGGKSTKAKRKASTWLDTPGRAAGIQGRHERQRQFLDRYGVTVADVRQWARDNGHEVSTSGAFVPLNVLDAYEAAHRG